MRTHYSRAAGTPRRRALALGSEARQGRRACNDYRLGRFPSIKALGARTAPTPMTVLPNKVTTPAPETARGAQVPAQPAAPAERRRHGPALITESRRRGIYIPLRLRVALTFLAGILWVCFSLWLSRAWIR